MNKLAKPARKQSKVHRSLLLGSFSALGLLAVSTVTAGAKAVNVGTGDTVWGIAQREGLSTTKIEQTNPSISRVTNSIDLIFAGQQLQLPTATSLNQSLSQQGLYTVQKGDTLGRIATHFHVTVAQLKSWNHLNSDLIYVGQQLVVNGDSAKLVSPSISTAASTNEVSSPEETTSAADAQPTTTSSTQPAASLVSVSAASSSVATVNTETPAQSVASSQPQTTVTSDTVVSAADASSAAVVNSADQAITGDNNVAGTSQLPQSTNQEVAQQPAAADANAENGSQSSSDVTSASSYALAQSASTTGTAQTMNVQTNQISNSSNSAWTLDNSFVEVPTQSAAQSSNTLTSYASQSTQDVNQATQSAQSTAVQASQTQSQQASQTTSPSTSAASNSSDLQSGSVVSLAVKLANSNIPYVWGGNSLSGMDCSGLVDYVYAHATGKQLPHNTVALESCVNQHPVSQATAGDLLFWGQHGATYHTAIYIGNNQYVAAPQPGQNVQIQSISQYFMPSFAGTVK